MIVLGVDPGSRFTGYGLVDLSGRKPKHLDHGVIKTVDKEFFHERLWVLFQGIQALCKKHSPDLAVLEKTFFAKNASSALKLGQARGAVLTAIASSGLEVQEISPNEVKKTLVGHGHARKEGVRKMVCGHLGLSNIDSLDASDALAIALTGALTWHFTKRVHQQSQTKGLRSGGS